MSEAAPLPENVRFRSLKGVMGSRTFKTHVDGETQEDRSRNRVSACRGSLRIKQISRLLVPADAGTSQPPIRVLLPT